MPKRLRVLLEFTEAETYKSGVDGRQAAFRNRISKREICDIPLIFVKARSVIAIEEKLRVQQRDRVMLIVICRLYDSHTDANRVMRALEAAGLPQSATGMISNNSDSWYSGTKADNVIPIRQDTAGGKADGKVEGAAVGAAIGATAATAASLITMLAIPGVGAIVGAGWLAAILGSMAIGGVAGGLLGALTNAGISEEDAQVFVEGVRRGGTLVAARVPQTESPRVEAIMNQSAVSLPERCDLYRRSGWQSFDPNAVPYTADQVRCERALHAH
jgi:hypothetical protein